VLKVRSSLNVLLNLVYTHTHTHTLKLTTLQAHKENTHNVTVI